MEKEISKHWKNQEILRITLKRQGDGKMEASNYSFGLTFLNISASWSDLEKTGWQGNLRPAPIFFEMWHLWTPHLDLRFTRSQRLGATPDDQNDGLVLYEALQHPMTPSRGHRRLPYVDLCASKKPLGGLDPVSWTIKIIHVLIPTIQKAKRVQTYAFGNRPGFPLLLGYIFVA